MGSIDRWQTSTQAYTCYNQVRPRRIMSFNDYHVTLVFHFSHTEDIVVFNHQYVRRNIKTENLVKLQPEVFYSINVS